MAISKAKLLRQLLVVLDTTVSGAVYATAVGAAYLLEVYGGYQWRDHIVLLPLVLLIAGPLSRWSKPTLVGQTIYVQWAISRLSTSPIVTSEGLPITVVR